MNDIIGTIEKLNNSSVPSLLLAAAVSLLAGLFIFYVYQRTYTGVYYSTAFNRSLVLILLVTTMLIRIIAVNPLLTLGMVGAVSIVRYRTAVKEPMDSVYMLWAVAEGIIIGSGKSDFILFGLVSTAVVGVVIFLYSLSKGKDDLPYLLVVRHETSAASDVSLALKHLPRSSRVKSRTVTKGGVEVIVELRLSSNNPAVVNSFRRITGVTDAELVELHSDYSAE